MVNNSKRGLTKDLISVILYTVPKGTNKKFYEVFNYDK